MSEGFPWNTILFPERFFEYTGNTTSALQGAQSVALPGQLLQVMPAVPPLTSPQEDS